MFAFPLLVVAQLLAGPGFHPPLSIPPAAPKAALTSPARLGDALVEEAYLGQWGAASASDGENHLVVWSDHRAGGYWSDLMMARVSPDGTLLDPVNLPLATGAVAEHSPAICWTGRDYFAAWTAMGREGTTVRTASIDREGHVVPHATLFPGAHPPPQPLVAANGASVVVGTLGGQQLVILHGTDQRIAYTDNLLVHDLVSLDRGFAAVGTRVGRVYFSRFDAAGKVERGVEITSYNEGAQVRAASNGTAMFVGVFQYGRGTQLYLVSPDGTNRQIGSLELPVLPVLGWDGTRFLAVVSSAGGTDTKFFDAEGNPLNSQSITFQRPFRVTTISSAGGRVLLTGEDVPAPPPYRLAAIRGVSLTSGHEVEISRSAPMEFGAVATPADYGYFSAWLESINTAAHQYSQQLPGRVVAARLDAAGRQQLTVLIADSVSEKTSLSVASGSLGDVVSWIEGEGNEQRVHAVRTLPAGDRAVFSLPWRAWRAAVVQRANEHFFAFTPDGLETFGARVAADGTLVDAVPLPLGRGGQTPKLVQVGAETLLATATHVPLCQVTCPAPPPGEMHVRRIAANGTVIGEFLVSNERSQPVIACGDRCLVAWVSPDGDEQRLALRTFDHGLQSPSRIVIVPDRWVIDTPSVAWNGREFVVAWAERTSESTASFLMVVSRHGEPGPTLKVSENRAMEWENIYSPSPQPVVASRGHGGSIVIYGEHDLRSGGVKRLFLRLFGGEARRRMVRR